MQLMDEKQFLELWELYDEFHDANIMHVDLHIGDSEMDLTARIVLWLPWKNEQNLATPDVLRLELRRTSIVKINKDTSRQIFVFLCCYSSLNINWSNDLVYCCLDYDIASVDEPKLDLSFLEYSEFYLAGKEIYWSIESRNGEAPNVS